MGYSAVNERFAVEDLGRCFYAFGRELTFYRLRAMRDFGTVKKGDFGGYVQEPDALSIKGTCWADRGSFILQGAHLSGQAFLQSSVLSGLSEVGGSAWLISTAAHDVRCSGQFLSDGSELRSFIGLGSSSVISSRLYRCVMRGQAQADDCILVNVRLSGRCVLRRAVLQGDENEMLQADGLNITDCSIYGQKNFFTFLEKYVRTQAEAGRELI